MGSGSTHWTCTVSDDELWKSISGEEDLREEFMVATIATIATTVNVL
jgi:hypothetical protein